MPPGGQQRIPRPPSFRAGGPAPWANAAPAALRLSLDAIRARLAASPEARPPILQVEDATAAAVLVPLFEADGEAVVILTKRPETMPSHQGEIAFPGGKFDAERDLDIRATALREAQEEIGLDPAEVEIVARLDGIGTVASRFVISPFVGFLTERPHLVAHEREVVRILEVPLSELMADGVYREERWDTSAAGYEVRELGVHFYELEDETVWGATARILTTFLTALVDTG